MTLNYGRFAMITNSEKLPTDLNYLAKFNICVDMAWKNKSPLRLWWRHTMGGSRWPYTVYHNQQVIKLSLLMTVNAAFYQWY